MINTFKWRLTLSYVALILIFVLIGGLLGMRYFEKFHIESLRRSVVSQANLVGEMLGESDLRSPSPELADLARRASEDTDARITVVALDGSLLADSQEDGTTIGNLSRLPEIRKALQGDPYFLTRHNPELGADVLYAAVPVIRDGSVQGAVRMAMPLTGIKSMLDQYWWLVFVLIGLAGILGLLVSLRFVNRMTTPLSDMTEVACSMAEGNLTRRVHYNRDDEIGILANAMNTMAASLDEKISEISEVKTRLETVLENTVNGIILIGTSDQVLFINSAARKLLGVEEADVIGKRPIEVTHSFALTQCVDQVIKDRKPTQREFVLHTIGERTVQTNIVPIEDRSTLQGILVVVNDITELKKLETIRKDFVANVSHELKTPISAISGFAETLMDETSDNPTALEFSRIIYEETLRLARMVESLLELSRIESIDPNLNLEEFDIRDCVVQSLERLDPQFNDKGLSAETDFPEEPVMVKADWDRITQVIINLLDNAITYSREGGTIEIGIENRPHDILVSVTDHGPGIPRHETSRIFERFYRVDKARTRKDGGSGLGLSIVKHIVEVHGGYVDVRSRLGQGSTFFFTLPKK
ncbi:MAG: two-component system histidine kinase PnpS [Syntrophomonadales bacterium]|jgi:two-component system phosphate regulon sensor histidine kinase PhoR